MIRSYRGKYPVFDSSVYVDPSAQVIGDVEIGEHSSIGRTALCAAMFITYG